MQKIDIFKRTLIVLWANLFTVFSFSQNSHIVTIPLTSPNNTFSPEYEYKITVFNHTPHKLSIVDSLFISEITKIQPIIDIFADDSISVSLQNKSTRDIIPFNNPTLLASQDILQKTANIAVINTSPNGLYNFKMHTLLPKSYQLSPLKLLVIDFNLPELLTIDLTNKQIPLQNQMILQKSPLPLEIVKLIQHSYYLREDHPSLLYFYVKNNSH